MKGGGYEHGLGVVGEGGDRGKWGSRKEREAGRQFRDELVKALYGEMGV